MKLNSRHPAPQKMNPRAPQLIRSANLAERCDDDNRQKRKRSGAFHPWRPRSCAGDAGASGGALCRTHGRPLDAYCRTDEQIICAVCASAEHRGQRIGCVEEERRRKQEELKNMQTKSTQIRLEHKKKWKDLEKILEQIQDETRQAQDRCESVLVAVIDSLQRHHLSVRELIEAQEAAAAAPVRLSMQNLKAKLEEMKRRDAELAHLAHEDSDVRFLQEWLSMRHLCEEDHLRPLCEDSEDPLPCFESTKRAVEHLGRQLEDLCEKEFASIYESAGSGKWQESAGEMREDDMKLGCEASISRSHDACELTLDPTTAHEDLVIFGGGKEVKLSPQIFKSLAVRHPQRFVHRRQVLCREGLQAEHCYYEIEVEGDKAEIALTYRGIDRKSRTRASAFGGNENSWSLDRSANYSVSHRNDSVQLTARPSHQRIGVYLRFMEGTLSFYEVSDSMIFLYKVQAKFTELLYPGFWLGENGCIRICDLSHERP